MPYAINDTCIACGSCADACASDAIVAGTTYRILPEKCVDCGSCADACPENAIAPAAKKGS